MLCYDHHDKKQDQTSACHRQKQDRRDALHQGRRQGAGDGPQGGEPLSKRLYIGQISRVMIYCEQDLYEVNKGGDGRGIKVFFRGVFALPTFITKGGV